VRADEKLSAFLELQASIHPGISPIPLPSLRLLNA
jgi:hypothetical protein